ncbi:uncharacterized protein with ParB-like and HNH nuclease domain [Flavobacterium sp. 9]|uniref:DUF262 domain-containing protein n=1 Tax=Flavobacterium sp. 9 TaxID=2035198 RepID=UPI000C19C8A8|nr:DUF262 domain-containing protein [Flavobacterium sp. 9]PIF32206.1 uncharacterized protein with ParB-like and HNH nuclease domain [Flavobacterium sp. 9]
MNIKSIDKTIKELLSSGKQFSIPRFQREYSWDKKNYQELLDDMISCLIINEGVLESSSYFLGTMLFIGDYSENSENSKSILVVDGQQRITTITILFSALSDRFKRLGEEKLSTQIFKYIMTEDDDGNEVRVLESKTHYPYFSFYIQDREKNDIQNTSTEEEECIKESFDYLYENLEEKKLRVHLKKKLGSKDVDDLSYIDILKTIRDQILNTTFISISTFDKENANMIFEILNAKGKKLSHVDLIKNKIFEIVDENGSADFAEVKWNEIKQNLISRHETIGFATFYRHFWISNYKKTSGSKLYDDFQKEIKPKTKDRYKNFLKEVERDSEIYIKILNPRREDYGNRKEYFWLVQSLNVLMNYFNIVQVRIALLSLFKAKDNDLITTAKFKSTIIFLENFHFAYNSIFSGRASRFENTYSKFAISLNSATNKTDTSKIIEENLIEPLNNLLPDYLQFSKNFVELTFSKKDHPNNIKSKYIIGKINSHFENSDVFSDIGTIEHIKSEKDGFTSLNIGNLILLEARLNNEAGDKSYEDKKEIYLKSSYKWINDFTKSNDDWKEDSIKIRAEELSKFYYTKILGRTI